MTRLFIVMLPEILVFAQTTTASVALNDLKYSVIVNIKEYISEK
jgi:hypothetical protein